MNIFILDKDPITAASYLCDKHVIKMALESAQILSTVNHIKGNPGPYRPTHMHHPCVIWANDSLENYEWTIEHALEICNQYALRYGPNKIHKSSSVIEWAAKQKLGFSQQQLTPFALVIKKELLETVDISDVVGSYRTYYWEDKKRFATWKCGEPKWWQEMKTSLL